MTFAHTRVRKAFARKILHFHVSDKPNRYMLQLMSKRPGPVSTDHQKLIYLHDDSELLV